MSTLKFDEKAAEDLVKAYSTPDVKAQRQTVIDLLSLAKGERVIDIGSGPGFLCEAMAERVGPEGAVLGIDISDDLIALCEARNPPPHLSYAKEDALALSAADASFDVAVSTQVAEYIPDTAKLLAEIYRVVRPGGRALILATDWNCIGWFSEQPDRMRRMLTAWESHAAYPSLPRTLARDLQDAGFATPDVHAHPIINLSFDPSKYSYGVAKIIRSYVEANAKEHAAEAKDWFDELQSLATAGRYYFVTSRMIFIAEKPA